MRRKLTCALLSALLLLFQTTFASELGDRILSHLRKDEWKLAYELALEVTKKSGVTPRDKGLAAMAALRGGDHTLAARLVSDDEGRHAWQVLAQASLAQLRNQTKAAKRWAQEALNDPETVNDARAMLFGICQLEGAFAEAVPYGKALLEAEPKGYPFDELLPQLKGLVQVYPLITERPKVEPAQGMNVRVPLSKVRPYLTVEAKLDDKSATLAIDTGGSVHPSLAPAAAKNLGITPLASSSAFGFGGLETIEIGTVEKLQIGDVSIGKQPIALIGMLDMLHRFMGISGVLDTRWLLDYVATFKLDEKVLLIQDPAVAREDTNRLVPLSGGRKRVTVPFSLIGDAKMLVPIKLNDWECWALLDTGAPINMFSFEWMQSVLKEGEYKIGPSLTGGVGTTAERGKSLISSKPLTLTIGGHAITVARPVGQDSLDNVVSHGLGFRLGALLGLELFKDAEEFTIDGPARRLYIVFKEASEEVPPTAVEN